MIYVVFWYLVSVTVLSTIYQFYNLTTMKADNGSKLGLIIGTNFRFVVFLYFLYAVYPLLSLIK
mgnify:CR=1 FL=1